MSEVKIKINDEEYTLIIEKKISTKNMYLRVKDDLSIHVSCNVFCSNQMILDFIRCNQNKVLRMIALMKKKKAKEEFFYYLGRKYDLIYLNTDKIQFGETKVFVPNQFDLDSWYKKEALRIFQEELDLMYHNYVYTIPYPTLTIRKMKTRWGVCNVKTKRVTLNLELIKKEKRYLDYVIVHELSHLLYANHSKSFWKCVEDNFPDYKKIRKELKYDE